MPTLPIANGSLLVRTDFSNEATWQQVSQEAQQESAESFHASVEPVSDTAFDGAAWRAVQASVPTNRNGAAVLFIADATALTVPEHPLLVVGLSAHRHRPPFRCIPAQLRSIDNNLNLATMNWESFAGATDQGGVYRGFS